MQVLVVEDEAPASQKLIRLLADINAHVRIVGIVRSVEQTVNWMLNNPEPDLILMDIQLEDGICFEIFEKINIQTPIIFITAYDAYTLRAFKVNSIDYLLKPIDAEELQQAIEKYQQHYKAFDFYQLDKVIQQMQLTAKSRFLIKIGEHFKPVQTSDIRCFFIRARCTFIHVSSGRNYPVDYSLDKIESQVDTRQFFRVSRHFIVNFTAIQDIIAYSSHRLKIVLIDWTEKEEVLVSRERVTAFKAWMDR